MCFFSAQHPGLKSSCQFYLINGENKILGLGQKKIGKNNVTSRTFDLLQGVSHKRSQSFKTWDQITEHSLQIIFSTEPIVQIWLSLNFKTKPKIQAKLKMSPS